MDIKVSSIDQPEILDNIKAFDPKVIAGVKVESVNETDGRKIVLEDESWILIRYSGTEPVFRIYVEAENESRMLQMQDEVLESLGMKPKI